MKKIILIAICSLFLTGCLNDTGRQEIKDVYTEAKEYEALEETEKAFEYYQKLTELQPGGYSLEIMAEAYFNQAVRKDHTESSNFAIKKYLEAAEAFKQEKNYLKQADMLVRVGYIYLWDEYSGKDIQLALDSLRAAFQVPFDESVSRYEVLEKQGRDFIISTFGIYYEDKESLKAGVIDSLNKQIIFSDADLSPYDCETAFLYIFPGIEEEGLVLSNGIAGCAFFRGEDEMAIRWYRKELQQYLAGSKPQEEHSDPSNRLFIALAMQGDIESAKKSITNRSEALQIVFRLQDEIIHHRGRFDWKKLLTNSLEIFDAPSEQIDLYTELAELSEKQGQTQEIRDYYEMALDIAEKSENDRAAKELQKRIAALSK